MSNPTSTDSPVDERDAAVADALDMTIGQTEPALEDCLDQLADHDIDPLVEQLLATLVDTVSDLQDTIEDLQDAHEATHDIATTASAASEQNASEIDDLDTQQEETHEVAKSAIAKAQQLEADADHQEDAEQLPHGVEPSSSPLDFFANCRHQKIKTMFVEESNRQNTFRAISVATRWPEFATERTDGSGVFFTKDDLEDALLAELGSTPHRQTVARVWDKLQELGGTDLVHKTRQVGRKQDQTELLAMDIETAEGLLDKRYVGLDLLDGSEDKATTGGVTPVVTGEEGATA
ncbi:hypothetical protein [Haloarcula nitratireducens]|uniref:Uncharacterized protein n=1 Tax=Haloarcula nitratireducens TaxID=2487749 RepID=A0AAW4PGF8_9EURY|nr:hypothetical protein [Halomicroarcula nitratireducens]MBX0296673.1 hypothetical protein [Halomicroarcula nitratireducens]